MNLKDANAVKAISNGCLTNAKCLWLKNVNEKTSFHRTHTSQLVLKINTQLVPKTLKKFSKKLLFVENMEMNDTCLN